jgi:hypothetical protein
VTRSWTIAAFVEGSDGLPRKEFLLRIWRELLPGSLSLLKLDRVVPISKKHLLALDPRNPPMSGSSEPLDALMVRELEKRSYDVALVAWDLIPAWNKAASVCRWEETLDLYRYLAQSRHLKDPWKKSARERYRELSARETPGARTRLPSLTAGLVLGLCMEPVFETLLVQDEMLIRKALGVTGKNVPGWPIWDPIRSRRPDTELLQKAIVAAHRLRPAPAIFRKIHGDMRTAKDEWGHYLLSQLLEDPAGREMLLRQPVIRRMRELLGR